MVKRNFGGGWEGVQGETAYNYLVLPIKSGGDKKILDDLLGGLSLVPFGLLALYAALAQALGWTSWANLGAPLYPGLVIAWLLDRRISQHYWARYGFRFGLHQDKSATPTASSTRRFVIFFLAGLALTGLMNATLPMQIRLAPLWFGVIVGLRGRDWMQRGWTGPGALHLAAGLIPLGMGVAPLLLNLPPDSPYFGAASIYELAVMSAALGAIGLLEHLIFIRLQGSGADQAP